MSVSLDDAKEAKQEINQGNLRENDAGISEQFEFDYEQHDAPLVQGHQESLITFDYIAGLSVFNTADDFLEQRQNLRGGGQRGYGNDVILTVKNPELVDGTLWEFSDDDAFKDYKVLGNPAADTNHYELRENVKYDDDGDVTGAETVGVDLGMAKFDGTPVEGGFDTEYIQILVPSSRAESLLAALDTAGKWSHNQDGEFTEGVLEAPPELGTDDYDADTHGHPRVIGYPELRSDMDGQRGAIAWTYDIEDDEEPSKQSPVSLNVYKITDGEDGSTLEALAPLTPEDDAYAKPTYPRGNGLYWDENGGNTGSGESSTTGGVDEAQQMMDDSDGVELSDDAEGFVSDALEAMDQMDYDSVTDFDDFDDRVKTAKADGDIDADADTLADVIDERAGGSE
jgi:hypothetical protein